MSTIEIHGPFLPEYRVTLDGFRVPFVTATPTDDGRVDVFIDRRFAMEGSVSRDEFDRWLPILANAMAVAAGYSSFGENSGRSNPFQVRMSRLGHVQPSLSVIDGDKDKLPICDRCGAKVSDPCLTDREAASCELPDSSFPNGRGAAVSNGDRHG